MREEDMSNISNGWADTEDKHKLKCPMCGTEGWVIEYPDDNGSGWFCNNKDCFFSCNPEDLSKIVAAMEMAKTFVQYKIELENDGDYVEDFIMRMNHTEKRVLEAFK